MDKFERQKKRAALKKKCIDYKGGKCEICSYDNCNSAFDFHHINSFEKEFNISGKTIWNEKLEQELQKCVLLCSNCHREVHEGLHPDYLQLDDKEKYYI